MLEYDFFFLHKIPLCCSLLLCFFFFCVIVMQCVTDISVQFKSRVEFLFDFSPYTVSTTNVYGYVCADYLHIMYVISLEIGFEIVSISNNFVFVFLQCHINYHNNMQGGVWEKPILC